jgi:hypothetical protein
MKQKKRSPFSWFPERQRCANFVNLTISPRNLAYQNSEKGGVVNCLSSNKTPHHKFDSVKSFISKMEKMLEQHSNQIKKRANEQ